MINNDTICLSYHAEAIAILLALFMGFQYGYGRKERREARKRKALYEEYQAKQPRAQK